MSPKWMFWPKEKQWWQHFSPYTALWLLNDENIPQSGTVEDQVGTSHMLLNNNAHVTNGNLNLGGGTDCAKFENPELTFTRPTPFTAVCWARPTANVHVSRMIAHFGNDNGFIVGQYYYGPDVGIYFGRFNGGTQRYLRGGPAVQLDQWQMLTGVFDGTHMGTYLNNPPTPHTSQATAAGLFNETPVWLGAELDLSGTLYSYQGALRFCAVFPYAFSPANVASLYSACLENIQF